MEKPKRWHLYLILVVLVLTLYNILPTIFYYTKPLNQPIDATRANQVAGEVVSRVDSLEGDAIDWIYSFSKLLGIKPTSVTLQQNDPYLIEVAFKNENDASLFQRILPRAGALIPFVPSQLGIFPQQPGMAADRVLVQRQIGVHLDPTSIDKMFHFTSKYDKDGKITPFYRDLVEDRVIQLALGFAGPSRTAQMMTTLAEHPEASQNTLILAVAQDLQKFSENFGDDATLSKRYFSYFAQSSRLDSAQLLSSFQSKAESLKAKLTTESETLSKGNISADSPEAQRLSLINSQKATLETALAFLKENLSAFKANQKPLTEKELKAAFNQGFAALKLSDKLQILNLKGYNPLVQGIIINWGDDSLSLSLYDDIATTMANESQENESAALHKERLTQLVVEEMSRVGRLADENLLPQGNSFGVSLNALTNTSSLLAMDLGALARKYSDQLLQQLRAQWNPQHPDLIHSAYPLVTYDEYKKMTPEEQKLALVVYAPSMYEQPEIPNLRPGSVYIVARGMMSLIDKYQQTAEAKGSKSFAEGVNKLQGILQHAGFIAYPGTAYGLPAEFRKDLIFEYNDYYNTLLKATREDFTVKGSKRFAVLDFTNVGQRILTENKIDDAIQEDLLKWVEEYNVAQVDLNPSNRYQVPAPTKNPYWQNFKLSFIKYFRGDDRKILKWGLDLSGGKTVRIGLRDHNNRPVTDPEDLRQAVNELYARVNNMGVSERAIHIEGNNIILDFPGSQGISAEELIKASAMSFHIVNEKFSNSNSNLGEAVNRFLQDVWNEAVVTNRKDIDSINDIAWRHLGGDPESGETFPRNEDAKLLYENGLRIPRSKETPSVSAFNDTLSAVAMWRGDEFSEWQGQTNPLLFVFHNYALKGSDLTDIRVGYDPTEGNVLSFTVKRSYEGSQDEANSGAGNPRDAFYAWTSQFAEDRIAGTPKESYTHSHGWRMAVILNDKVISAPALRAALRDGATISGRFSQREINQLAADLKAGSLTFTPKILSEENVSPELGLEERTKGIVAASVALIAVVAIMLGYYRFAGFVASCAVLFNLLIMWGVLQNLGAALTLPGIAGVVLTIGMAVDANVLVFERIREEFSVSGRIASAIQAGYRKAFSAIIDSNITTILAAVILVQFDSGPIKGFAVMLIIGILSSMFTALFMTRYFFARWVQNPQHKELRMSRLLGQTNFDFIGKAKTVAMISLIVIALGTFFFTQERKTFFGMDFTGGYSVAIELAEKPGLTSYRTAVSDALQEAGATLNDFQIRELNRPNQLRIELGMSMEEKGHPFYQMPQTNNDAAAVTYDYERYPRMVWFVSALAARGLHIPQIELAHLSSNWSVISGQLSDTMRNNAIIALGVALVSMLIYITVRFEFKYAIAATLGLVYDVLMTLGILTFFHALGFSVQIDLQVIGAFMTIIGYALNDTIIVFDRIREDIHIMRKMKFHEIVNHALNVTLSRTIMTSGTTMVVLLSLVLLGGPSIFAFSLVMTIGVIVGTASSLFVASPLLLYFHNREEQRAALEAHETP